MHLIGYFEGIDSERGIEWRYSDSLSLRDFLRLGAGERVPDHFWLSKPRQLTIWSAWTRSFLAVETPTADDLVRMDRQCKDKKLSNKEWVSPVDPDAKIARMKDGGTHLAYKPEHAVDLDTGAIVAAEIHAADRGDTGTLPDTLMTAEDNLALVGKAPTEEDPAECVGNARTF